MELDCPTKNLNLKWQKRRGSMKKSLGGMKKKVIKHLKEDTKESKKQIKDDKGLQSFMSKKGKC